MALPADRFPSAAVSAAAHTPVCTVHTCRRCKRGLASLDPCSFLAAHTHVCRACQAEEEALKHLPLSRNVWGASLANIRRAS